LSEAATISATLRGVEAARTPRPPTINKAVELARLDWANPRFSKTKIDLQHAEKNLETYEANRSTAEFNLHKVNREFEPDPVDVTLYEDQVRKWEEAISITKRFTIANLRNELVYYESIIRQATGRLKKIGVTVGASQ
jgi:hypothetical protein